MFVSMAEVSCSNGKNMKNKYRERGRAGRNRRTMVLAILYMALSVRDHSKHCI